MDRLSKAQPHEGFSVKLRCVWRQYRAFNVDGNAGVGDRHGQPDVYNFWAVTDFKIDKKRPLDDAKSAFVFGNVELKTAVTLYKLNMSDCVEEYGPIADWDVSGVTQMNELFKGCPDFNGDLSKWDVSSVTNMAEMFNSCDKFEGGDLSKWTVSSVEFMSDMFKGCGQFNGDLSDWNVSSVTSMDGMFYGCKEFNGDLSEWDVSAVTNMDGMFKECPNVPIPEWADTIGIFLQPPADEDESSEEDDDNGNRDA